jgi:farnesyl-diphosphate farnesyltransferase
MEYASNQMLTALLRDVSRSFYLTLRVLPSSIRPQIGLAYLLARTTDTIADTELVAVDQRLAALQSLRERILGSRTGPLDFGELARQQGSPAERTLLAVLEAGCSAPVGALGEAADGEHHPEL